MKKKSAIAIALAITLVFSCISICAASTPAKVSGVHQISKSAGAVTVGWNKAKSAKKYQVYVSTNGKSGKYKKAATTTSKKYTLKGFGNNKTLWVKVRAINGNKNGKFSDKVKVVTGKKKQSTPVNPVNDPPVYAPNGTCEKYRQQMMQFANQPNFIYSPISLNTAMNICQAYYPNNSAVNGLVNGKNYLGYKYKDKTYKSVNRIWVNKDLNVKTPDAVKKYEYRISMKDSKKATAEKNKYVSDNTNGFIKGTPTTLDSSVEYDIMNVLYFKDTWKNGDLKKDTQTTKFNNKTNVKMILANAKYYYENDTAYVIPLEYEHGNRMLLIYPKNDINSVNLSNIENSKVNNKANIKFPPFKTELSFTPNAALKELPVQVMQTVKIEVNEKGTEAAAVTEGVKCTSMPPRQDPLNLTFDKPFMYAIEDTVNGDIAFMGMIQSL